MFAYFSQSSNNYTLILVKAKYVNAYIYAYIITYIYSCISSYIYKLYPYIHVQLYMHINTCIIHENLSQSLLPELLSPGSNSSWHRS